METNSKKLSQAYDLWNTAVVDEVVRLVEEYGINDVWIIYLERDLLDHKECLEYLYFTTDNI